MSPLYRAISLGFLIGIAGLLLSFFHFAHELEEDTGLGLLFKLRGVREAPSDVVIVSIDRESSELLNVSGTPARWPRSIYARLIEKLNHAGARVITFDVYFVEPRSPEEDNVLAETLSKARNVVLAEPLRAREIFSPNMVGSYTNAHRIVKRVKPIPVLSRSAIGTAPFVLPRIPVKVNQYWTFQTSAGDSPSLPVVAFQHYALSVYAEFLRLLENVRPKEAGRLPRAIDATVQAGGAVTLIRTIRRIFESDPSIAENMRRDLEQSDLVVRNAHQYRLLRSLIKLYGGTNHPYLNYYGPPRTLITIPFHQVLRPSEEPASEKSVNFKDKAVFVGLSEVFFTDKEDSFYTVFPQANGVFHSGVEIAGTAFLNLLEDLPVKPVGSGYYMFTIALWGIIIGIICSLSSIAIAGLGATALSLLYLFGAAYQFKIDASWYPIVIPLFVQSPLAFLGAFLWKYVETNKERQQIRKALGFYVPDEVVNELARNMLDIKHSGRMVYGACLFADVAGYTTLSEKMNPQQLSDLMHRYFEATFEPVKTYGGQIVDLKGDSFLAIWKAARADDGMRRRACLAALDVARAVRRFNGTVENVKLPTRVGVHSGQIFLGNIGAGDRYEYGARGDTVNTASRMDGLNKYLGTEVLASDEIIGQFDDLLTREVGKFLLKGKAQPIVVHEILCLVEESNEKQKQACAIFAEALAAFRSRSWNEAAEKFHQAMDGSVSDGPARFYMNLCETYKRTPPREWDGVVAVEEK
jgi:adenylate cyclase